MNGNRFTRLLVAILSLFSITSTTWADDEGLDAVTDFDIPAQPLEAALIRFSEQADLQLVMASATVDGKEVKGVSGEYVNRDVLDNLLAGTGLGYQSIDDRTIAVSEREASAVSGKSQPASNPILMAQNQTSAPQNQISRQSQISNNSDDEQTLEIEEIIVTGTNIRGVAPYSSPLVQFDRQDIDTSGAATVGEFIQRSVPQNFAAGAAEDRFGVTRDNAQFNQGGGTGINLRGLGTDSTLVLLNGRRMAPSGTGTFVDVSQIPLSALERVDILMDGASAIYGSDAIGGVVNFVLRDDYEGAETRVRYGPDFGADYSDFQFGQSFGRKWSTGSALVSYEYANRDALNANERELTADNLDPFDILPEQERHSLFFNASQELGARVDGYTTLLYTSRDSARDLFSDAQGVPVNLDSDVEQWNTTLGTLIDLGTTWQMDVSASLSEATTERDEIEIATGNAFETGVGSEQTTLTIDAKFDGDIIALSGGTVKLAFGGQYRDLELIDLNSTVPDDKFDRDVSALFAEVYIPIVGQTNARPGVQRLELTAAARYEDYSEFGDTTDPKIGLLWSPADGFNVRSSWGTSFRAPRLTELDESFNSLLLFPASNPTLPGGGGTTLIAIPVGGNSALTPEEATTFTIGFDVAPTSIPGLQIGVTYFDIDFEDRIQNFIIPDIIFLSSFTDPHLGAVGHV